MRNKRNMMVYYIGIPTKLVSESQVRPLYMLEYIAYNLKDKITHCALSRWAESVHGGLPGGTKIWFLVYYVDIYNAASF